MPAPLFAAGPRPRTRRPKPGRDRPGRTGRAVPLAELRSRIARLLDRTARLPEELDLAEAICAVRWPNWPAYRGPVDLFRLRRALQGTAIDARTLHWLGGKEIGPECGAAGRAAHRRA